MTNTLEVVIDTNILFMGLEYPERKAGQILKAGFEEKISLVSPITVMFELYGGFKKKIKKREKDM